MISSSPIAAGSVSEAVAYFEAAFSENAQRETALSRADNYYVDDQAQARWHGQIAEELGLAGQVVEKRDFADLLTGRIHVHGRDRISDEPTRELVADLSGAENRRAGLDFTFSVPKSVSVAWLVGGDERIAEAARQANEAAMTFLERHAGAVQIHQGGEVRIEQTGTLLRATVEHETSRNLDPQGHFHNVIFNVGKGEDGKWRSMRNDGLMEHRRAADTIAMGELAHRLQTLGYQLEFAKNGSWEIAGFKAEQVVDGKVVQEGQLAAFSTRTAERDAQLLAWGVHPDKATTQQRQDAVLATRTKKVELPRNVVQAYQQETAQRVGLDLPTMVREARQRAPQASKELRQTGPEAAMRTVGLAIRDLAEREQAFTRPALHARAVEFARGSMSPTALDAAIDRHLKGRDAILRERPLRDGSNYLTTVTAIRNETALRDLVQEGKGRGVTVLQSDAEFAAALAKFEARKSAELKVEFRLTDEQVTASRNLLMHADQAQAIQGDAGTGKTTALEFVREVLDAKGWTMVGVATTASAAKELEKATGIPSLTVAGFLNQDGNRSLLLQHEIQQLQGRVALQDAQAAVQVATLHARDQHQDFGKHRYAFDLQSGDVYRTGTTLMQRLGERAAGLGESLQARASEMSDSSVLRDRLASWALGAAGQASNAAARSMTTYERVGEQEALAARSMLYTDEARQEGGAKLPASLQQQLQRKQAELDNITRTGNSEGARTLIVMDEASLTGTVDMSRVAQIAKLTGARFTLQGDLKQKISVPAGAAMQQMVDSGINVSYIKITRRFDNATEATKEAVRDLAAGRHMLGMARLPSLEVDESKWVATVGERYMANRAELMQRGIADPSVGIVTTTNADRKAINNEVRSRLQDVGVVAKESVQKLHFEDPKLTSAANTLVSQMQAAGVDRLGFGDDIPAVGVRRGDILEVRSFDAAKNEVTLLNSAGREIRINPSVQTDVSSYVTEQRQYAIGDRVVARSNIAKSRLEEADGHRIVKNGTAGVITAVDERGMTVRWTDGDGASRLTNQQVGHVDHAYSRTTFKSQGETTHRHIIAAHTGVHNFNRQDAYVAASRAKDQTEIVTTDYSTLLLNSTRAVDRVTAIDIASPAGLQAQADPHPGHRVVIGQLVSHGEARFRNNEDAQMSYQVRLKIEADKVITIWGSDLRRAVEEGKAAKGDMIVVQELGRDQAAGPRARVNWSIERLSDIQSLTELTKAAQTREKTAGRDIAPENAQQKERRTLEGELVSMGDAPYRNRAGAKQTFVVKVRDAQGKIREAWGSEAKKAVMDAGLQPGDQVRLRDLGKSDVMAQVPGSRDSVQRQRNVWSAERIEPVRAVQGEKSMEAAPEKDRAQQAPAKTERQIERPQVPDASAAPVQKLDQADEQSAQRQRSRGDGMSMG